MQVVLLAAGQSSRFYPFNKSDHKTMVSVCGKPILEHTLLSLSKKGLTEIIIVVSPNSSIMSYFGNGEKLGIKITYVVQEKPLGMGNALLMAKDMISGDFLVMNASHVDIGEFLKNILSVKKESNGVVVSQIREETWKYGVLEYDGERVLSVVEKPKKGDEPSKLCLAGIYVLNKTFLSILSETPEEQYQFEVALSRFAKEQNLYHVETKKEFTTLKYPWDLFTIKKYLFSKQKPSVHVNAKIAKSAEIIGNVVIETGAKIMEKAVIKGPCFIGKNVVIGNHAIVRDFTCLEEGSVVGARMEIKKTLLMQGSTTHSGFIGDSVIGKNCKIAADFITGNVRLDRKEIKVVVKGEEVSTGRKTLGVVMGNNVHVGIKCSTMPGVIVGKNVVIGPTTSVIKNILDNSKYYTKISEVIEKI